MRVEELKIDRENSYSDNPGKLRGTIKMKDDLKGSIEVPLTPAAISVLLKSVQGVVIDNFKDMARDVPKALESAQDEGLLLELDGEIIPEDGKPY